MIIIIVFRVPDGHVSAVANQFIIRKIDTASDDFMFSSNLFDVAKRQNLWSEEVSYHHPYININNNSSHKRMVN